MAKFLISNIFTRVFVVCTFVDAMALASEMENVFQKAEQLSLQKDRMKVTQLLVDLHNRLPLNQKGKVQKKLDQLSSLFYTEEGQNKYASALSVMPKNPEMALDRLEEAAKLEPLNQKVELARVVAHIELNKCPRGMATLKEYKRHNFVSTEVFLVEAQVTLCLKGLLAETWETLEKRALAGPHKEILLWLRVQEAIEEEDTNKLTKVLKTMEPEKSRLRYRARWDLAHWKNSLLQGRPKKEYAIEYLKKCKSFAKKPIVTPPLLPNYCKKVLDVEQHLESQSAQEARS